MTNRKSLPIFFLLLAALLFAGGLSAQKSKPNTEKGIFLFKGGTNFQLKLEDGNPFRIQAGLGYFPIQNLVVGADLGYEKAGEFDDFWARPFVRYYLFRRLFFGGGLNGVLIAGEEDKEKLVPDVEAGFALFLDPQVAFEPTVRYLVQDGAKPEISINLTIFFSRF